MPVPSKLTMWPILAGFTAALLASAVMSGCTAAATSSTGPAESANRVPDSPAPKADASPVYRPAQQPGGSSEDPTKMLERYSEKERLEIQELEAAVNWALQRSRQLRAEGALDRERDMLRDILNQLQNRPGTGDYLHSRISELEARAREVEGFLGNPVGNRGAREQNSFNETVQESKVEANVHFTEGKRAMEEQRYKDAIERFQKVKDILQFAPYAAELEENYREQVERLMRECQEKVRDQQAQDMMLERDKAKEEETLVRRMQEEKRLQTIEAIWGDALFNMQLKRFSASERLCEQILALDPAFAKARDMKHDIQSMRVRDFRDRTYERKLDMYRRLWADWYDAKIPLAGSPIQYPTGDEWLRIKSRSNVAANAYQDPPAVAHAKRALAVTQVPMNFEEAVFTEVIGTVAAKSNLNIIVAPEIKAEMEKATVTLQLSNLPLKNSLKILLDLFGLTYDIRDEGIIWITRGGKTYTPSRMITRLHDVRDLTVRTKDFAGTRIRLNNSPTSGSSNASPLWEDQVEPNTAKPLDTNQLQDLIAKNIAQDSWGREATIQTVAGQLLIRNTPEVHDEVNQFLKDLRDVSGLVVTITARFITIDDMVLSDFGVDFRGLGGQSPGNTVRLDDVTVDSPDFAGGTVDNGANAIPPGAAIAGLFFNNGTANTNRDIRGRFENVFESTLGNVLRTTGGLGLQFSIFNNNRDQQFQMVLNALQKSRNAAILVAPRLSAFNNQRANLTIINQVSYVRDFTVQTAVSSAIADPVVDTISDGLVLDVRPTVSNDRRFITIELQPTIADLVRPIPEFTTTLGGANSTPVTIQLPELQIQSLQTTVMCPDGGVVVVGGLKALRDVDRESTTPLLGDIPILGTLFRRKGRSLENRSLIVVVKAQITDLAEEESHMR